MRVVDLFCGAGGFSHGFVQAGHEVILGIDNDERCRKTYRHNHPNADFWHMDLETLAQVPPCEIIIGSPPCVEFSKANNRRTFDFTLVKIFFDLVGNSLAKWWIMENVPPLFEILTGQPMKVLFDAADYGVPQRRKRAFFGKFKIPLPTHNEHPQHTLDGRLLKRWVSVGEALDIPYNPQTYLTNHWNLSSGGNSPFYEAQGPVRTLTTIPPKVIDLSQLNQKVLERHLPVRLDQVSPAIIRNIFRGRIYRLIDMGHCISELSPQECAILQGFPKDFKFFGSTTQKYKMIGNAVPPPLARALGEVLLE